MIILYKTNYCNGRDMQHIAVWSCFRTVVDVYISGTLSGQCCLSIYITSLESSLPHFVVCTICSSCIENKAYVIRRTSLMLAAIT